MPASSADRLHDIRAVTRAIRSRYTGEFSGNPGCRHHAGGLWWVLIDRRDRLEIYGVTPTIYLNCPLCGYSAKRSERAHKPDGPPHCPRCARRGLSITLVVASHPGQTLDEDSVVEWPTSTEDSGSRVGDVVRGSLRSGSRRPR